MLIRMRESRRGVEGKFILRRYRAGHIYDMNESLACAFLRDGSAEYAPPYAMEGL